MNKLDQFYTNPKITDYLVHVIHKLFILKDYTFIEPSAGTGNFIDSLYKIGVDVENYVKAYDLEPKSNSQIIKADFLNINFSKDNFEKTITIGNPPFGKRGVLALKFLNKSLEHSSIVGMILPMTFNRYSMQKQINKNCQLIHSEELETNSFLVNDREYNIRTIFQIWINQNVKVFRSDIRLKEPLKNKISSLETFIHNNTKQTLKYFNKEKYQWDFAIPRQGYYDYSKKITDEKELKKNVQYLFIKCNNPYLNKYLEKIDFVKLSKKNTLTLGFSNTDLIKELYLVWCQSKLKNINFPIFE